MPEGRLGGRPSVVLRGAAPPGWRGAPRGYGSGVRRAALLALLALAVVPGAPAPAAGPDEQVTARVDASRSGVVDGSPLRPPLRLRWQADLGVPALSPVLAAGRVFYVRQPGTGLHLTALDVATGKPVWDRPLGGIGSTDGLSYDAGRLYLGQGGRLRAYAATDGAPLWERDLVGGYPENYGSDFMVGVDGDVYAIRDTGTATLYRLRGGDGTIVWQARIISGTGAGPTVDGDSVYVAQGAGVLQAFDRATGAERWAYRTCCTGGGGGFAVQAGERLFQNGDGNTVHDRRSGQVVGGFEGTPPLVTGDLLVHGLPGGARAVRPDGSTAWQAALGDRFSDWRPSVVAGSGVFGADETAVRALDLASGAPTWCASPAPPPGSGAFPQPVVLGAGQGVLLVGMGYGLFAYENGGPSSGCDVQPAPAPATTTDPALVPPAGGGPALTLAAGRQRLVLGEATILRGVLGGVTDPGGRTLQVEVDEHPFGTARVRAEVRTSADGSFAVRAQPARNSRIRVVLAGTDVASPPVTLLADFPARVTKLGAGGPRPRLRWTVYAFPGAKARTRRAVFYHAPRGSRTLRRIAAVRWPVRRSRYVQATARYPRGALGRRGDRWMVCFREPPGGDGFGELVAADLRCGDRTIPLALVPR